MEITRVWYLRTMPVVDVSQIDEQVQCSPYQAVTGKIYRLKQHFLPPATSWSLTKIKEIVSKNMQVVIQADPLRKRK